MSFKTILLPILLTTNVLTASLLYNSRVDQTHVVSEKCEIGTVCTVKVSTK